MEITNIMAQVSKTQHEMDAISSGITKIAMEQLIETEDMPTLLDDLTAKSGEKAIATLRKGLSDGYGITISDTLKLPSRHEDGTLTANAQITGHIIFGLPEAKTEEFVVRTMLPSVADALNIAEREEFRIPIELLNLSFSDDKLNGRFISIKESGETKGKLFETSDIESLNFSSKANRKVNKLKELIENKKNMGYELLGLQVVEKPENFMHPTTKTQEQMNATNTIGVFLKRGAPSKLGAIENVKDEILVEG